MTEDGDGGRRMGTEDGRWVAEGMGGPDTCYSGAKRKRSQ